MPYREAARVMAPREPAQAGSEEDRDEAVPPVAIRARYRAARLNWVEKRRPAMIIMLVGATFALTIFIAVAIVSLKGQ